MKRKKSLALLITFIFMLTVFMPSTASAVTNFIHVFIDNDDLVTRVWVEYNGTYDEAFINGSKWKVDDNKLYVSNGIGSVKLQYTDGTIIIVPNNELEIGVEGGGNNGGGTVWVRLDALLVADPSISITKVADPTTVMAGDTIQYTLEVTNTGDTNLTGVVVTDPLTGLNYGPVSLNSGVSILLPVESYNTVYDDIPQVTNTATVSGWFFTTEVTDTAMAVVIVEVPPVPSISLTKVANPDSGFDLGEEVTYTFTITNDGEVPLTAVELEDDDIDFTSLIGSLAVGESVQVQATYNIVEADILEGMFENSATVTGTPEEGEPVADTATETVYTVSANNALYLQKTSTAPGTLNLGDDSFYSFYVENTGNVTLTNVHVEDMILGFSSGNLGSLAPGESKTVVDPLAVHEINEDDMVLGYYYNEADAYGTFQSTDDTSANDDETVMVNPVAPTLELEKLVVSEGPYNLSDEVEYSFTVTNNGLFAVTDIQVTDSDLDGGPFMTEVLDTLEPGQSYTFTTTGFHKVSEADVLAGYYMNYAEAVGYFGQEELTANDSVEIMIEEPSTGISITKTAEVSGDVGVGDEVYYTFEVTNTGDIDIVDVIVSDDVITIVDSYKDVLAPGETWTITGEGPYTTTESDAIEGSHKNIASVTGDTFLGPVKDSDSETINIVASPSILLEKSADVSEAAIDDTITYSFYVENTGDVTLTNVYVYDSTFDHTTSTVTLAPGEFYEWTDEVTHDVTESDAWNMNVQNFATAYGTPSTGGEVSDDDDVLVDIDSPMPAITLTKTADPGYAPIGGEITFTFTVANTGNVTLYDVFVEDEKLGFISTESITLDPGEDYELNETASYTLIEEDAYNGGFSNIAWAYGYAENQQEVSDDDMEFVETDEPNPSILLTKTAEPDTLAQIGDEITYTFTVQNTGNVTLYNVYVEDSGLGFVSTDSITLAPQESITLSETAIYIILEEDSFAGAYSNTATAYGFEMESREPVTDDDTIRVPVASPEPGILIDKVALFEGVAAVGQEITFEFTVTNTGTVTLYNVSVSDTDLGFESTQLITLEPGESITLDETATYTIVEADSFAGSYTNTADAFGWPAQSEVPVTDSDIEVVDVVDAVWAINLDKSVNDSSVILGQSVTYTITVTNVGNVTLYWGDISDTMLGVSEYFEELAPGESIIINEGYTPDSGDIPSVTNTADVTAYTYREDMVSDEDSVTVTVTRPVIPPAYTPGISVTITPDADLVEAGTDVTFTMVVTNTGNTVLNNVVVTNTDLEFETTIPVLYVTGSETFTVVRTMTTSGDFTFTVVAQGTSPQIVAVSDTDVTTVGVFEEEIPENPPEEPIPGDTVENPQTGALPAGAMTVSGIITLGAGIFALIKRKKEDGEEE